MVVFVVPIAGRGLMTLDAQESLFLPSSAEVAAANSHGGGGRVRIAPKGTNDTFLRRNPTRYLNDNLRYLVHFWVV